MMSECAECGETIKSANQRCWETGGVCFAEDRGTSSGPLKGGWAEYKGHKYRLLYIGQTKYGLRAHLQFGDRSKDFWVDGSLVVALG